MSFRDRAHFLTAYQRSSDADSHYCNEQHHTIAIDISQFRFGSTPPPREANNFGGSSFGGPARSPATPQPGLFGTPLKGTTRLTGGLFGAQLQVQLHDARVVAAESIAFSDVVIKVVVGSGDLRRTFAVHEAVLFNHIGDSTEHVQAGANGILKLPDVEPEVFNLWLQHLYTQRLPSKPDGTDPGLNDHVHEFSLLCKFFALAKALRDSTATRDAINAMYAKAHERPVEGHPLLPNSISVDIVYKATDVSCGARKLMVDLHVWKAAGAWVKQHIDNGMPYPNEFVNDLAIALLVQKDLSKAAKLKKEVSEYYDTV